MPFFRKIGLYGGLAAILATLLLPAGAAHAQTAPARPPLNLMTSPLPLNVVTKPGVPVTADIRIKNNGAQPEQLKVQLLKFGANGDSGQPKILDPGPNDIYFNWVHFSETNFDAEPNVWKTIHMTITPPKEAAFGYYYAVVFSRANPDKPKNGQSAFEGGVASLVLLSVEAPGSRREAQIVSLTATKKVYEFLPSQFNVKLHNNGNLHVAPTGTMFIKRGGTQVATIDFNSERGNILPGTDRVFSMNWNDGFPAYEDVKDGDKTVHKLVWDFGKLQKLRFGRYTAQLVAVYDDGQRDVPIEAVVSFWVIPWRILGVILLIVLFIGGGFFAFMRLIWKNIKRQALAGVQVVPAAAPQAPPAEAAESSDPPQPAKPSKKARKAQKAAQAQSAPAPAAAQKPAPAPAPQIVIQEPAPADNSLAAALGKRKKRSLFSFRSKPESVEEPAPVDAAMPVQQQNQAQRPETRKDRQQKKQQGQYQDAQSQTQQKQSQQQPRSQKPPRHSKPAPQQRQQTAPAPQPAAAEQPHNDRPAQTRQVNPNNWAQSSGKKGTARKNKKNKHRRRNG